MNKLLLFILFLLPTTQVVSQDVIVLKKDEFEIKCWIVAINDTIITYKPWNSEVDTQHIVRRVDVLSFLIDHKTRGRETNMFIGVNNAMIGIPLKNKPEPIQISDAGNSKTSNDRNLARYRSGELQPGYIVKNTGDSITGELRIKNVAQNQLKVNFTDSSGINYKYTTNDLKAYGYAGLRYEKVNIGYKKPISNNLSSTDGNYFLHLEIDGKAKLYRFYTLFFSKGVLLSDINPPLYHAKINDHYVMSNLVGDNLLTKGRTLKGCANRLYSDNPKLMETIRMKGLKVRDLNHVINTMNEWYEKEK